MAPDRPDLNIYQHRARLENSIQCQVLTGSLPGKRLSFVKSLALIRSGGIHSGIHRLALIHAGARVVTNRGGHHK